MATRPVVEYIIPEWSLADRLRKARSTTGMDQRKFAKAISVTHAAYSHWELGLNTPRNLVVIAKRIEKITRIPAAWLLGVDPGPEIYFHGKTLSHSMGVTKSRAARCHSRSFRVAA